MALHSSLFSVFLMSSLLVPSLFVANVSFEDPGFKVRKHELEEAGLAEVAFGKTLRKEFFLQPGITFINHGSYGTVPRRVLKLQHEYNEEREEHVDMWYRYSAKIYLDQAREAVASFIGADRVDTVMMTVNVTTALNAVVKSFPFKVGDALMDTNFSFGAIAKLCEDFCSRIRPDVERVQVHLNLPITSEDQVVEAFEQVLQKHRNIKMAIIDHITSPTSILMPVKRLSALCQRYGVLAVVDGAHAFGQIKLDVQDLGADIYTTNLHKWGFSPRGCAVLWYAKQHEAWLQPPCTSWKIDQNMDTQFFHQGTCDHVPNICARHGLQFINALGGLEKMISYTSCLANKVKAMFLKEIGLESLAIPENMEAPNLKLIRIPPCSSHPVRHPPVENSRKLQRAIFGESCVFAAVVLIDDAYYIRLSVQVYNDLEDFTETVEAVRSFMARMKKTADGGTVRGKDVNEEVRVIHPQCLQDSSVDMQILSPAS